MKPFKVQMIRVFMPYINRMIENEQRHLQLLENEEAPSELIEDSKRCIHHLKLRYDKYVKYVETPANTNNVLVAGQFICDKCQFKRIHRTGRDEYPAYTTTEYCSKGHWEGGDTPNAGDIDHWSNCADFVPCT